MKLGVMVTVLALVAVPAVAMQQDRNAAKAAPTRPHELTFYEHVSYGGGAMAVAQPRASIRTPWNIRSIGIHPGDTWQICARSRFRDPCIMLSRSVHDASLVGIEGQVGSVRHASEVPAGSQGTASSE